MDMCTVLIASADLLPSLKPRAVEGQNELLAFTDADALRALEVITKRRPQIVTLERLFAATPRGAALIHRIKADPSLLDSEIRVISHDTDVSRVLPRQAPPAGATQAGPAMHAAVATAAAAAPAPAAAPLDQRGTRRAPRFKIAAGVGVLIDGNATALIDLSSVGAQVVSTTVLKPNQRVRVGFTDEAGNLRFIASVAWAKFEIPSGSGPRYRAGLDFVDGNAQLIDAYCARHKA
jgi:hypothetical protein